ncbi:MAG TPA: hypothetical protein VHU13_09000 [Solirubrobacteraceae bacterium]|jgi:hypothetical protein|nr:hypothetical protein [Solirubrobacteraceae bacterium]
MAVTTAPTFFEAPDVRSRERLHEAGTYRGVPAYVLDVPETIPQLGYGSHQFFRYYGKFPSVVGAEIVKRHGVDGAPVLDCYAGSGTTLVEAQSAGYPSYGLDINPLAVLASQVKLSYVDPTELRGALGQVAAAAPQLVKEHPDLPRSMSVAKLDKWFSPAAQQELACLRDALMQLPPSATRSFLLISFLGIVRRVSTAYDGEVRPHVNPDKRQRSPIAAFVRKATEMVDALHEVEALRPPEVIGTCKLGDNRAPAQYESLLGEAKPGLVVAHPPYLNSFNYLQVFSLEFAWSEGFDEVFQGVPLATLREAEHRAWPATDDLLLAKYYEDFENALRTASAVAAPSARVAVVIGDATIRRRLEAVHVVMWEALEALGLQPVEVWFRTTHYGIGKYAYSHRADYHGADAEKKDAILVFEKP